MMRLVKKTRKKKEDLIVFEYFIILIICFAFALFVS